MCISMSGTVALCCFFAPKVYIVIWQPYKNVRMRQSAVGRLVNQQMRFISQIATTTAPESTIVCSSVGDYYSSYPPIASCSIIDTEGTSAASSQIAQQPEHFSPPTVKKSLLMCNVSSNNNCDVIGSNKNNGKSTTVGKTAILDHPSKLISYSYDSLTKDTVIQDDHVELFLEQLVANNNDVTFL